MSGQMCWLAGFGTNGQKILHLREQPHKPWLPYTATVHRTPDYNVPGGSKGWSTYQKLRQAGWELVPTAQAQSSAVLQRSHKGFDLNSAEGCDAISA